MIKSYKGKLAKKIAIGIKPHNMSNNLFRKTKIKFTELDKIANVYELGKKISGNDLKKVEGTTDRWSIRINRQFRIRFTWYEGNVFDVEVGDFH